MFRPSRRATRLFRGGRRMLNIADLTVQHGASRVVQNLRVTVGTGTAAALLGANGSGKSTVLQAVAGLIRPVRGSIQINGEEIADLPLHWVVARGVALVPEDRRLILPLSVRENLDLSAAADRGCTASRRNEVFALFPELADAADVRASSLPPAQRLMLAIGRAIMTRPEIILIDQPSRGLDSSDAARIYTGLAQIRDLGYSILLADQNIGLALGLADYGYVMRHGALAAHGKPDALQNTDEIAEAYLG